MFWKESLGLPEDLQSETLCLSLLSKGQVSKIICDFQLWMEIGKKITDNIFHFSSTHLGPVVLVLAGIKLHFFLSSWDSAMFWIRYEIP